ncbi:MAG: hypothetical protein LBT27_07480 [Prevotellaceae bacterium]|jgi:opacity protein-like surface antigen|nr:hypothetical protein [Prevotellaceae bacterium]
MKKLLVVAVFVTALFAAQNANGNVCKDEEKTSSQVQISNNDQNDEISLGLGGSCITCSKPIKLGNKVYERKFKNSCSYSVSFEYKFWNGQKWIKVNYTLSANQSANLPAGVDGSIDDFYE